jgi:carboxylesterase
MPLVPVAVTLALAAAFFVIRRRFSRVTEALVAQRFPTGEDGVVAGAEGYTLEGGKAAVLLLHGFGDTPQSVQALADHLHRGGWTVRAPLLPGHGRSLRAFSRSRATEWCRFVLEEHDRLRASHGAVAVIGQSMGGALAVILAGERRDVTALVLLSPYLTMLPKVARLARVHRLVAVATPYVRTRSEASIWDAAERSRSLGFGVVAPRSLAELLAVTRAAWAAAPRIVAPTLVLQSSSDNRISGEDALRAFQRLGTPRKELAWLSGRGHVIAVDHGREEVFARAADWLRRHEEV